MPANRALDLHGARMMDIDKFSERWTPEPFSGCWLWTGSDNGRYGQIRSNKKNVTAHRLSWQLHKGDIPQGACVLHRCDTPACVNPEHLFLGSLKDNQQDSIAKGKRNNPHGILHSAVKLSESQVREIRSSNESERATARRFGISRAHAHNIKNRLKWKHLI